MTITQERLKEILHYDPETGVFTWRVDRGTRKLKGLVAGTDNGDGYIRIRIFGVKYLAHRLSVLYTTGEWPKEVVDHFNMKVGDNRLENLRQETRSQNSANSNCRVNSRSGVRGLCWHEHSKSWRVQVRGEQGTHCSYHKCKLNAVATLYRLQRIIYGEFARHQ